MPLYELREWIAVARADEISERLAFQYDLSGYTRAISKDGESSLARERDKLSKRYKELMCLTTQEKDIDETWGQIKQMGVLGLIKGGK